MYKKRILFALLAISIFSLSGCVSNTYERGEATWTDRCKRYGFKVGTDAFANCMLTEHNAYRKRLQDFLDD